jgi:hypothetical protein
MRARAGEEPAGHEDSDARPRIVGLIAGALAALVAVGLLVGWGFVEAGKGAATQSELSSRFQDGPQARTDVDRAWTEYERDTRSHLSGYGWVDRPAGIVRIPIDRAIDLVCAAEARKSTDPGEALPTP